MGKSAGKTYLRYRNISLGKHVNKLDIHKSSKRPVISDVPHKPVLGPIPSNIFINNLDDRTECTLSRCAGEELEE